MSEYKFDPENFEVPETSVQFGWVCGVIVGFIVWGVSNFPLGVGLGIAAAILGAGLSAYHNDKKKFEKKNANRVE